MSEFSVLRRISAFELLSEHILSVEEKIGELLEKKGLTVATAESCTGGNVAARITSVSGCSSYFKGGIVAYSNDVKSALLYVNSDVLKNYGAVSEETVVEMVKGAMRVLETDCAIATSGIAGPGGGTLEKPVGTIWIAAGNKDEIVTVKLQGDKGRELNVRGATEKTLLLLYHLMK